MIEGQGHVLFYQGQSSKTHYIHIFHHIQGTIILILMFWGHTLEVLNRTGNVVNGLRSRSSVFIKVRALKLPKCKEDIFFYI